MGTRHGLTADYLRGHEAGGTEYPRRAIPIDRHIVVIADEDFARIGVEEEVAEGNVAIAKTLRVELQKAVGEFKTSSGERAEGRVDAALHEVDEAAVAGVAKRHDVAVTRVAGGGDKVNRPEETGVRSAFLDEALDAVSLELSGSARQIPLQGYGFAGNSGAVYLSLSTTAEKWTYLTIESGRLGAENLAGLQELEQESE